jgi:hypothetical protein
MKGNILESFAFFFFCFCFFVCLSVCLFVDLFSVVIQNPGLANRTAM